MFRLRDYLPFLKGWKYELFEKRNQDISRKVKTFIRVEEEKGWLVGATMLTNNKYTTLEIIAGTRKITFIPEYVYFLRLQNPLKPSYMPFILRYSEDSPGSETGFFAVALDPADWIPYRGSFEVRAQIPDKVILPDYTTAYPTATTAKIYWAGFLRIKITDEKAFFSTLSETLWHTILGRAITGKVKEKIVELLGL